jgi:tetratricopeptide (TPR) repeat protein
VRFIQASADESRSSLVKQAAQILQERGVDAALEFLEKNRAERGRRVREEARELAEAALFEAELHTGKLKFEPAIKAVRAAIEFDYRWWKPHNRLGQLNLELARWDESEREFKEAERFVEREEDRAVALNNLAQLLQATNRLGEAEPLMERALAIDERSYGPEHPNVARDLNNLAQLLQATNRQGEAEPLMKRALVIFLKFTRATGHEHPELRKVFGNYKRLIKAQHLTEAQTQTRLAGLGPEAGYGADEWRRLQSGL